MARTTIPPHMARRMLPFWRWTSLSGSGILPSISCSSPFRHRKVIVSMSTSWVSPFSLPGIWLKGNLHTHTTRSDGLYSPEKAMAWYNEQGYDFVALTDHWVHASGRTWEDGILSISGAELHGRGYHMLTLGITEVPDRTLEHDPITLARLINEQGGLAYIAHPYWTGQTSAEIATIPGIAGIEVYNAVCEAMVGLGHARVHWDELLAQGMRLYGLAVDDSHWRHDTQGIGYVMVRAERADEASILEALRQGHFYSSTGPRIDDMRLVRDADGRLSLRVRCSPCRHITFYACGPLGRRFTAPEGRSLDGAEYPLREEQVYLRVECQDDAGRTAWSNPIYIADLDMAR